MVEHTKPAPKTQQTPFPEPPSVPIASGKKNPGKWRSGLLLASSFVLGGLAVTLWNRQTVARLHKELNGKGHPDQGRSEEDEE
jgi:hypothetical protein